jgi:exodeoxyribonuclease VII small subunit
MKSFEERLERLEEINETINASDLPLEEAVAQFEEGIRLARGLEKELGKIERKVEILLNQPESADDSPNLELFPELDSESTISDGSNGD